MSGRTWRNWSGTRRCEVRERLVPVDLPSLRAMVRAASRAGHGLRVAGAGHAWLPLVPPRDALLDLRRLDRGLGVRDDRIRVEAGMQVGALADLAARHGLSVVASPAFRGLTVGGAVATGSHGSGTRDGTFSDLVVGATLVTADGELVEIDEADPRLDAVRVSLGALGAVYALTLRGRPAFRVEVRHRRLPLDEALAAFPSLAATHEHPYLIWIPCTGEALLRLGRPTDRPGERTALDRARARAAESARAALGGPLWRAVSTRRPSWTPRLCRAALTALPQRDEVQETGDFFQFTRTLPRHVEAELCVPAADGPALVAMIANALDREAREGRYPVNIAVTLRLTRGSTAWLSPAAGLDACAWVSVASIVGTPGAEAFCRAIEAEGRARFDARPHWGRMLFDVDAVRARRRADLARFESLRRALDPTGTFLNPLLERLLAPEIP